jgi:deoxycytidine triphosphate deaminase
MRLLVDREISAGLGHPDQFAETILNGRTAAISNAQVQAASLDLTIGDIFIPGTDVTRPGGCNNPKIQHVLKQGQTAVIRTQETLHMGNGRAGIAFPPAGKSLEGMLMTNPGHIDPGYDGPLHCTVINMAHSGLSLRRGDRIMRVLFFEFGETERPQRTYADRGGIAAGQVGQSPITLELLDSLSLDFIDVEKRASQVAQEAINRAQVRSLGVPFFVALVTGIVSFATTYYTSVLSLKDEVKSLRSDLAVATIKADMRDKFEERLKKLEDTLKAIPAAVPQTRNVP